MKNSIRYIVIFESEIPTLELIVEKLKGYLENAIESERSSLMSSEYLDGVNTYILYSTPEDIIEIVIVEDEINELHIYTEVYSDDKMNLLLESVLLILKEEGGKVIYDSSIKNGWLQ